MFDTIWGDMNSIKSSETSTSPDKEKPVEEEEIKTPITIKVEPEGDASKPKPKEDEDQEGDEEDDENKDKNLEKPKEPENIDDIEFTEDEAENVFAVLDAEGVLDISDDDDFEASKKGIAEAIAVTVRKKVDEKLVNAPEEVKQLYAHLAAGKPREEFEFIKSRESWSELDQDDEDNKEAAVIEFLRMQNVDEEDLEDELADIKASGKLDKKAGVAFKALEKKEQADIEAKKEADKKAAKKAEEDAAKEVEKLKTQIGNIKEIAGFSMTDERREKFEDYLFKVDKKTGKTQLEKNMSDNDRRLRIAFLDFIEYNKEDITKEVTTEVTKNRKRRLSRKTRGGVTNSNSSKTVKKVTPNKSGKLKIPAMFGGPSN